MGIITTKDGVQIFYKDWAKVSSSCWPLSAYDWDTQMLFFLKEGYRVVAHDRRGHGRSTQTSDAAHHPLPPPVCRSSDVRNGQRKINWPLGGALSDV